MATLKTQHPTIDWLGETDWVLAPSQDRSRKGLETILLTAKTLFVANGYDETTITQISKAAGISVGSIYHRFPDKQSILFAVLECYRRVRFAQVEEMTRAELWRDKTLRDVLDFHIEIIFSSTRSDAGLMRMVERQRMVNPAVRDMQTLQDNTFCAMLANLYRPHAHLCRRPDVDTMVSYIQQIIRGAVLCSILSPDAPGQFLNIYNEEFRDEAFRMAAAYIGLQVDD